MTDPRTLSLEEKRSLARALLLKESERGRTEARRTTEAPIAILGFGCRYPGGVVDAESFWQLLDGGVDAVREIPMSRWNADALYDPDPEATGHTTTRAAGLLENVDTFDPAFFGIAPREAMHLDPQQRLLLECSWEALEHAGITPSSIAGSQVGVFAGLMSHDYEIMHFGGLESLSGHVLVGNAGSIASGRISYTLGLKGPSLTVDTACSSSLVAVHLACQSLRSGESELALAGGVTLLLSPRLHVEFARMRGLAADGRCKSFSAQADGVGWAEGCGLVVLKRLDDALRDGDPILGVIRGSAVNQDGRSNGLTAPNGPSQEAVLRRALAAAALERDQIDYVEAHGTGTTLGDPIEARALQAIFGQGRPADHPLWLGSVKSNLGHTQAAAGIAGIIKILLAMRHERLPATLHAGTPSPHIDWADGSLQLVQQARGWPRGERRRIAGVSSFGVSGTNAHVLIEEPPAARPTRPAASRPAHLIPLSGHSPAALEDSAARLAAHLGRHPEIALADLAHTLSRRTAFEHRQALVAGSPSELIERLARLAAEPRRPRGKLAFLCTGQGSQVPDMGRALYEHFPAFRRAFDRCAAGLQEPLFGLGDRIHRTDHTQPALFALGWALAELWRSWGVRPDLVLGHSVGEYVAAAIAGVFSPEDGLALVAARGRLMHERCAPGVMIALDATEEEVHPRLVPFRDTVSIAALNGPRQTVISGVEADALAVAALFGGGQRLTTSHAFHSPMMRPMLEDFAAVAARVRYSAPTLPVVSNLTGATGADLATADYWVRHVMAPVRFADSVVAAHAAGARSMVEIGPRPILLGMGARCVGDTEVAWLPSMRGERRAVEDLLAAAGALWGRGAELAWREIEEGELVELPPVAFQRERFWMPTSAPAAPRAPLATDHRGLLGQRLPSPAALAIYESELSPTSLPWLPDHRVFGSLIIPGAALIAWTQAAVDDRFGPGAFQIAEMIISRAFVVPEEAPLRGQLVISQAEEGALRVSLHSSPVGENDRWTEHAVGRLVPASAPALPIPPMPAPPTQLTQPAPAAAISIEDTYARFAAGGLPFGPAFQAIREAWRQEDGSLVAEISLDAPTAAHPDRQGWHPALIDAVLQVTALGDRIEAGRLYLPLVFSDVVFGVQGARSVRVRAEFLSHSEELLTGTATAWDADGSLVLHVGRLECKRVSHQSLIGKHQGAGQDLYRQRWRPLPPVASAALPARVLVVSSGPLSPLGEALSRRLRERGTVVASCSPEELLAASDAGQAPGAVVFLAATSGSAEQATLAALSVARWRLATPDASRLFWVTERAQATQEGDEISPVSAACWGLGRVLLVEDTSTDEPTTLLLDAGDAGDADKLLAEMATPASEETQISLRHGQRSGPRLVRAPLPPATPTRSLAGGAVLITGGLGAIGLSLAQHLARVHGARHLVLAGRRAPEAVPAAVAELRAAGVRVELASLDISDRAAVAALLAGLDVPLVGVVHAAGVGDACLLARQTPERFAEALRAKVQGAILLDEWTQKTPLELFVLLSSIASVVPEAGQGSYAAANAFLDGLAHQRRARGLPAISLNFGPWAGAGMMEKLTSAERDRLVAGGIDLLSPGRALAAFDEALRHGGPQLLLVALDTERRQRLYSSRTGHSGQARHGVPALWQELIQTRPAAPRRDAAPRTQFSGPMSDAELEAVVRTEIAAVLLLPSADQVPPERALSDLGIDSLTGIKLRERLSSLSGCKLPAALVWEHPTAAAIARHLRDQLTRLAQLPHTTQAPQATESAPGGTPEAAMQPASPGVAARSPAARARPVMAEQGPIRLHPEPTLPPIFGIGGALGGGTYLKDLATALGPLQPFYTAAYPGLEEDESPIDDMETFVDHFLARLRAAAPQGPYVLLGHSFGGLIAYEMAQRLSREGESVIEVLLLDTLNHQTSRERFNGELQNLDQLLAPFQQAGKLPADIRDYRPRFEQIWRANDRALRSYEPGPFPGDISLLIPEEALFATANIEGWKTLCPALKLRRAPGDHATMVLAPHARRTARILRDLLRDLDADLFERPVPLLPAPAPDPPAPALASAVLPALPARSPAPPSASVIFSGPPTQAQRWMWLLDRLMPGSARYNLFFGFRIRGPMEPAAVVRVLAALVARHEALRTAFPVSEEGDGPRQVVSDRGVIPLAIHELSGLSPEQSERVIEELKRELTRPFDLAQAPLGRALLCSRDHDDHRLFFCWHHSVIDGQSLVIFLREVRLLYEQEAHGRAAALPPLPWGSAGLLAWEQQHLTPARQDEHRAFWSTTLAGMPTLLLPTDRGPGRVRGDGGGIVNVAIHGPLTAQLKALATAEGVSLTMLLLAAYGALLHRHGGGDDFGIAMIVSLRQRPEHRDTLGCFVNTVMLRLRFPEGGTARDLLRSIRSGVLEALEHGELPFDQILRAGPAGLAAPAGFVAESLGERTLLTPDWQVVSDSISGDVAGTSKFDLSLTVGELAGEVRASFLYATEVFDAPTVERIAARFGVLLEAMVADPSVPAARLSILPPDERQRLICARSEKAHPRPAGAVLHGLVAEQARRLPEAVAVVAGDRSLTYRELDQRANGLALLLRERGVGPETRVGICAERSTELIIGLLAILKAGGAYVPLDPAYPPARTRFMRDDSGCAAVLVTRATAEAQEGIRIDQAKPRAEAPESGVSEQNLAYLIYTSGSTGTPKAVAIEHRSAVERMRWAHESYEDWTGVLASTSICFDLSVFEIFAPLTAGGRVLLVDNALALPRVTERVTLLNTVPSAAAELLQQGGIPASVRVINLAGEPLRSSLVDALYEQTRVDHVFDLYGPSEDTTYSTCARRERGGPETIGRPLPNTRAYVLDAGLDPAPIGVTGDLYLAGAGLARGYFGRPELTQERFVPDPFHGGRMYRTGDRARLRPDGSLELRGRVDHQVKLRGFRIELGEIEASLRPLVSEGLVGVREGRLIAWFVGPTTPADLRAQLARTLPAHLLPQDFVALPAFPLTPNGKVDRAALPDPDRQRRAFEPPQTAPEEAVAAVWREILSLPRVGREDHFFELGGDSLLATRAAARLSLAFGHEVLAVALFGQPILRSLAAELAASRDQARGDQARGLTASRGDEAREPAAPRGDQGTSVQRSAIARFGKKMARPPTARDSAATADKEPG